MNSARKHHGLTSEGLRAALQAIDPDCDREVWAKIAMALKSELGDDGFVLFEEWSKAGQGYRDRDCRDTWRSVRSQGGVGVGTLIWYARKAGFLMADINGSREGNGDHARSRAYDASPSCARTAASGSESDDWDRSPVQQQQERAATLAVQTWRAAKKAGDDHPYLEVKGVRAHGLAVGAWPLLNDSGVVFRHIPGTLIIPVIDAVSRKTISLQGIFLDPDGNIQKRYLKYGRKKGGCHVIGKLPPSGQPLAFCEGYATGASIHEATGWPVVVAFDAPNLPVVAGVLRRLFPRSAFMICADNDQWRGGGAIENPGVHYAELAARQARGCLVVPRFAHTETRPTDFNDLAALEGLAEVARQLLQTPLAGRGAHPANDNPENEPASVDYVTALIDLNSRGRPLATINNFKEICERIHVNIRYNIISKEEDIIIPGERFSVDNRLNNSLTWIESECAMFGFPTERVGAFVGYVADKNPYNPVSEWIESFPWDGVPRLQSLCETVSPVEAIFLSNGQRLSDVLIRRWMLSAVAAAYEPEGVSAHGILVLQGAQSLGKTMWFRRLVPGDIGVLQDGMILRPDDRDSVKQVCSFWLVELGELDATFRRSDLAALKAFITRKRDVLRRAYARKESTYARRTVFFGSVNPREFLHDATGNRRYWTIECAAIDHQHEFDMQQVWAEVREYYRQGEPYHLTDLEMAALNALNEQFMTVDPIEERLQVRLAWGADAGLWGWSTATEILLAVGVERPTQSDATKAAGVIRKLNGGRYRRSHGRNLLLCPPVIQGGP